MVGGSSGLFEVAQAHGEILEAADGFRHCIEFACADPRVGPGRHHQATIGSRHLVEQLVPGGVTRRGGVARHPRSQVAQLAVHAGRPGRGDEPRHRRPCSRRRTHTVRASQRPHRQRGPDPQQHAPHQCHPQDGRSEFGHNVEDSAPGQAASTRRSGCSPPALNRGGRGHMLAGPLEPSRRRRVPAWRSSQRDTTLNSSTCQREMGTGPSSAVASARSVGSRLA